MWPFTSDTWRNNGTLGSLMWWWATKPLAGVGAGGAALRSLPTQPFSNSMTFKVPPNPSYSVILRSVWSFPTQPFHDFMFIKIPSSPTVPSF